MNCTTLPTSIATYNDACGDACGDCFTLNSLVFMADGTRKTIDRIQKDDKIYCKETNSYSKVICVVKIIKKITNTTNIINSSIPEPFTLVNLGNTSIKPWITPYHPIRINGVWNHPINLKSTELITTNTGYDSNGYDSNGYDSNEFVLYNLVLNKGHTIMVNNIECATLGHNFQDEIVKHNYFGSNAIIDDLKTFDGWDDGFIVLNYKNRKIIRHSITNEVIRYQRLD